MTANDSENLLSGQFVLHTLISDFISHVDKKVEQLINYKLESSSSLTKDTLAKLLQRGEDPQFDQLLWSLGCVAEYCLSCLVDTLFNWYNHQIPGKQTVSVEKAQKDGQRSKSDVKQLDDTMTELFRKFSVEFVFCLVLIEILKQIPVHPLPDVQVRNILSKAFNSFHASAQPKDDNDEINILSDLYGEMIGVLAQTKFLAVQHKFMHELLNKDPNANTLIALIKGMKYFRVKMYPVEDFETSFRFMQELATYSLDLKNRDVKNALAGLFVEVLVPVAAAVKTEVNVPVLRDFVDSLYPTSLELSKRAKNKPAIFPLVTCLLCVSQKTFFLNNWHIFLDICLSTLKSRDSRLSRVALESLYRLLWVYMVRIKCESNTTTQARLQSIVKNLFPVGSRNVIPKDMPLNIFVKIIQFIALERLDFAMRDIILDLLATSSLRIVKPVTLYPERMNIALRAFLVVTDNLQQKDGAPPMPSTMNVMPSGNTIRVKKTFLNKTLTEEEARAIGVLQYLKPVQRSLGGILSALDSQVGLKLLQTNSQFIAKSPKDLITAEQKPKIELFKTCVAVLPRLMPHGLSHCELLNILCRLTVHVDDDLRNRAIIALQAFIIDFPTLSEEVVASFLSFVQNHITDVNFEVVNSSLKIAASLLSTWKTSVAGKEPKTLGKQSAGSLPKRSGNDVLSSVPISPGQSCSPYSSIISRCEGFAMVYLCHSRSQCRRLAFNVMKELRSLAIVLACGKLHDQLCLDCFDRLCYEVSVKVVREETYFQNMDSPETEVILSAGYERNFSSLIEHSVSWSEVDGYHPWMFFMMRFVDSFQASGMCGKALSYCWSDMFMRASQLQRYMEPFMTTGSKKSTYAALVDGEHTLTLFTHYLIFLCRSARSSVSVKHEQNVESAVAAGTPDWKVRLIRDRKKLDTVPSTLFRKMVEVLKSENFPPAFKESVVLGMGYTSVAGFQDLLVELQHVLREATESKKQENVRRRRKRDNIRMFLLKLFTNLSVHRILSKGIYKQVEKVGPGKKIPREIIQEYIDDAWSYLEVLDKSETTMVTSFSSQQLNVTLASNSQVTFYQNTAAIKEDMKLNFSNLLIHLVLNYPIPSRPNLLKPVTKKLLFHLFGSWYDKCIKDSEKSTLSQTYAQKMLSAQCSIMCCGPIFDDAGLKENGYLYDFLELLLSSPNKFVQHLGQESIGLLLHFNPKILYCRTWIFDKCYTSDDIVARACFLGIAFSYHDTGCCNSIITTLTLALFSTTDPDLEVSQAAEHLLNDLLEEYFPNNATTESSDFSSSSCAFDVSQRDHIGSSAAFKNLHPRLRVTKSLVQHLPELTYFILSEIFVRFTRANSTRQRRLLEIVHLWLWNVKLIPADLKTEHNADTESISTSMVSKNGWGSEEGSIFILNNLMYLTVFYRHSFEAEIQNCWTVLSATWQDNLSVCLQYFSALYSVQSKDTLRSAVRHAITCVSRKNGSQVLSVLLDRCLRPHPVNVAVEPQVGQPFYKVVVHSTSSGTESPRSSSTGNVIAEESIESSPAKKLLSEDENISKAEPIDFLKSSVSPRRGITRKHPSNFRLSLQIPLHGDSRSLHDHRMVDFSLKDSGKPSRIPFKGMAKLSSSMMSLSKTGTSSTLGDDSDLVRFNTLSSEQPIERPTKHRGLSILSNKHSTSQEMISEESRASPELIAASVPSDLIPVGPTHSEIVELMAWREHYVAGSAPKPLPLFSSSFHLPLHKLVCCDKVVSLTCSSMTCIFLSQIVISQCFDIEWQLHLPIVTLSLLVNMDQLALKEVPFYCRKMLAHIVLEIVGKHVPGYLVSSILSYTNMPSSDILGLYSSYRLLCSQTEEQNLYSKINPESNDTLLKESIKKLLTDLVCESSELWAYEDVSPKVHALKSIDKLSAFVYSLTDVIDGFMPKIQFKQSLAHEAMNFAVSTPFSHYACRSLQIFRALQFPLTPRMLDRLVHCLLSKIAYGTNVRMQSNVLEILLTLLRDCDFGLECNESLTSVNSTHIRIDPGTPQSPKLTPPRPPGSHPIGRADGSASPSSKGRTHVSKQSDMSKASRKVHAHRRSGSVTLSKKMTVDLLNATVGPNGVFDTSSSGTKLHPDANSIRSDSGLLSLQKRESPTQHGHSKAVKAMLTPTLSNFIGYDSKTSLLNRDGNRRFFERHAAFAQMFWISAALLESDYEHEFLLALQLLEKVLTHLPLSNTENELHIERHFAQIKWKSFPGIQNLLLKGLTSSMTSDLSFYVLSSFTAFTHMHLISGDLGERCGFAMNVVAVLPHMLDCFEDSDVQCLTAAERIAAVCVKRYSQEKKLQHLAHVMLRYADHTYEHSESIWISVVAKYLHETFPEVIREQIEFLSLMLERGPASMHSSCIRIIHGLLFQSELLLSSKQSDVMFLHHTLKTVAKLVNNPKLWKDALMILKLAVSRSSAIATPTIPPLLQSASFASDGDRLTLPGRTLTFKYNITGTPVIGRHQTDDDKRRLTGNPGSPTIHHRSSFAISSWKKPVISQKRTHERMFYVAQICGSRMLVADSEETSDDGNEISDNSQDRNATRQVGSDSNENERDDSAVFDDEKEQEVVEAGDEIEIEDIGVLRNFDFLDEFDENDEGFTTGYQKSNQVNPDEVNNLEDDPDTCNLTPFVLPDISHDIDHAPSEENSDFSDISEQELPSQTSGILSQSWQENKSLLTETGSKELYSSLITISSPVKSDMAHSSSCESIEALESLGKCDLSAKFGMSETSFNSEGIPSQGSLVNYKEDDFSESATSDSVTTSVETDNEDIGGSVVKTKEASMQSQKDVPESMQNTVLPPPIVPASDSPYRHMKTVSECDIPIVEPPPITSDITSNLSAVPFGLATLPVPLSVATKPEQNIDFDVSPTVPESINYKDIIYTSWKIHMASLAPSNDASFIAKTFDLFPRLFDVLCVDFSDLSKKGCLLLGGQLSKIAEHFSSMVEQLPSQIKCPKCFASKPVLTPIVDKASEHIHKLHKHLEAYDAKRELAVECIEEIKEIEFTGDRESANTSKYKGMGHNQLKLCRLLYQLHHQLLQLLTCFNKLIKFCIAENVTNVTKHLDVLRKRILTIEKTYHPHRDKQDIDKIKNLKYHSIKEAEQVLTSSISNEHFHLAIRQLHLLRQLWPETFGHVNDSAGDFLAKILFKHLESQTDDKIFAILGSEEASNEVCEKLMEVNEQIQSSLESLALNTGDTVKAPILKKTHF